MPFWRRRRDEPPPQHAVITYLPLLGDEYGSDDERAAGHELEVRIEEAAAAIGAELDGDLFGGGEAVLYAYCPDADELLDVIHRCLEGFPMHAGAYAVKRSGAADDPDAREERVPLE